MMGDVCALVSLNSNSLWYESKPWNIVLAVGATGSEKRHCKHTLFSALERWLFHGKKVEAKHLLRI